MTDAFAQTYECMSKVTPGAIYLSYGRPCPLGTAAKGRTQTILGADAQGQFFVTAQINGFSVRSQIDTGATNVSLNMDDAQRMGVNFTGARRSIAQTANGAISVFNVTLSSVRVGDIELNNVPATVSDGGARQQAFVLIGMSFLRHLEMQHVGNTLTLLRP
jgi:aspartyl protease family protein